MTLNELNFLALLIIFAIPYLIWRVGRTDYYAPLVVVQIVTGIVLGPGVLGGVFPEYYGFIFRPEVIQSLNSLALWAVVLFVWLAGIELDLGTAWRERRESGITAGCALLVPLATGAMVGVALWSFGGWSGVRAEGWQFVLGVGMACAVTALPILVLFLERLDLLTRPLGQRVLRYASLDDLLIWAVLALILADWDRLGRQLMFLLLFAAAAWITRRLMERLPITDRWFVGLAWLIVSSLGADWSGLHFMVGAFLAGVVLDKSWFGDDSLSQARRYVLMLLMPVFFLSTGLRTQWDMGGWLVFAAAAALLIAAVGGKLLGVEIAGRWLGWSRIETRIVGWLLQTKALIMIIFANVLLDREVISPEMFTALVLMAVASTMLTIPKVSPLAARLAARGTDGE